MSDLDALLAQYNDPNRPGPCDECRRRPVPSRLAPGQWVDNHRGDCSQNSALHVCERCGHRHAERDFGQVLACVMEVPLAEGREMQRRIVQRLEAPASGEPRVGGPLNYWMSASR